MRKTSVPIVDDAVKAVTEEIIKENKAVAKTVKNDPNASTNHK